MLFDCVVINCHWHELILVGWIDSTVSTGDQHPNSTLAVGAVHRVIPAELANRSEIWAQNVRYNREQGRKLIH